MWDDEGWSTLRLGPGEACKSMRDLFLRRRAPGQGDPRRKMERKSGRFFHGALRCRRMKRCRPMLGHC